MIINSSSHQISAKAPKKRAKLFHCYLSFCRLSANHQSLPENPRASSFIRSFSKMFQNISDCFFLPMIFFPKREEMVRFHGSILRETGKIFSRQVVLFLNILIIFLIVNFQNILTNDNFSFPLSNWKINNFNLKIDKNTFSHFLLFQADILEQTCQVTKANKQTNQSKQTNNSRRAILVNSCLESCPTL